MQPLSRYLFPGFVAVCAVAGLYGLRDDIGSISLAPLVRSWELVAVAALCSLVNYVLRIVRWQRYLARLGRQLPFGFVGLTYLAGFAFTVSPGKVGEMARARYYAPLGIAVADVAAAFFIERLMDVMAMMALAVLIVVSLPHYHIVMWTAAAIVAAVLVTLTAVPWQSATKWLAGQIHLPQWVVRFGAGVTRTLAAARALLSAGALLSGFLLGLAAWGLEGVGLFGLGGLFPALHLPLSTGIGIYAVAVLVGALSFLPGGLGGTEAAMTALLSAHGFGVADALLVTIVCRLVTLWLAVLIGWLAVLALRQRPARVVPSWP